MTVAPATPKVAEEKKRERPKVMRVINDDFDEVVVNGDRCMRVDTIFFRIHVQRPGRY